MDVVLPVEAEFFSLVFVGAGELTQLFLFLPLLPFLLFFLLRDLFEAFAEVGVVEVDSPFFLFLPLQLVPLFFQFLEFVLVVFVVRDSTQVFFKQVEDADIFFREVVVGVLENGFVVVFVDLTCADALRSVG